MIPDSILASVNTWLKQKVNLNSSILTSNPLSGGSINSAYRLHTTDGDYFIKYNHASKYPSMFETEAKGLSILRSTGTITIPQVHRVETTGNYSFILMQYIKESTRQKNYWEIFADKLALLHQFRNNYFGLDHNNYIGSLHQNNHPETDFITFFIVRRLNPLVKTAIDAGLLTTIDQMHFERLYKALNNELPIEEPSLIHGDLWSGNLITDDLGLPCLIDPAVYYGHRELDIAMTMLFGGFNERFYSRYNEVYPLHVGWQKRIKLFQLYPLLVHVNLFGSSYSSQVRQIIKHF